MRICASVLHFLSMRLTIQVAIPALDRLVDYLEAQQQTHVDALTAQVVTFTSNLAQARAKLSTTIKENQ